MKYFLDTEFNEDGKTIDLISIGIVAEDGREFYAVNSEADYDRIWSDHRCEWLRQNVMPQIDRAFAITRAGIMDGVLQFITPGLPRPEFWGYYCDYDWVAFCQLFGRMIELPDAYPKYCRDIKQLADDLGNPKLPPQIGEHHALADARWNKQAFEFLQLYGWGKEQLRP